MRTDTPTLIAAMHRLSKDIQSEDGVANAAIFEAALRLQEQHERIKQFEEILPIIIKGERRGYIDGPEQYFAALKKAWALLEAKP